MQPNYPSSSDSSHPSRMGDEGASGRFGEVATNSKTGSSIRRSGDLQRSATTLSGIGETQPGTGGGGKSLKIGERLGRCLLLEELGRGATGTVFRAMHTALQMPVAIKVLRPDDFDTDRELYFTLTSEARLLAQITHPHVVRVLDFEDDPVLPYLVLEYIEGRSLADLLRQSGRLPLERALSIIMQVADGLGAAWKAGVVHRDVKPGNILLDRDGNAKLADLGQAIRLEILLEQASSGKVDGAGTPAYMAPEGFQGNPVDFRSDIYSLGATFYHAVTGQMPFTGKTAREVLMKHVSQEPVSPEKLVPEIGPQASELILRMLAKHPDERFSTHKELMDSLRRLMRSVAPSSGEHRVSGLMLFQQGVNAAKAGNKQKALALFKAVTEIEPRQEAAWMWIASVTESSQEAVSALQRVLALNPKNERAQEAIRKARLQAGFAELKAGKKSVARTYLQPLIESDPNNEQAWLGMAACADSLAETIEALERVVEINPKNEAARKSLQDRRSKLSSSAAQVWRCPLCLARGTEPTGRCGTCKAILNLSDPQAVCNNAEVDRDLLAVAITRLEAVRQTSPYFDVYFNLGLAYLNTGRPHEALAQLTEAAKLQPNNTDLQTSLQQLSDFIVQRSNTKREAAKPYILVVDDSETIRKVIASILESNGYRVRSAADGYEAMNMLKEEIPALVLLDITMPGLNGYQVCKLIRAEPRTKGIPVVMLSGNDGFFDKIRGRMAGSTRYLTKPCKTELLLETLKGYISA